MPMAEISLCDWLKGFSFNIWEKLYIVFTSSRLKLSETTITQDLVFNFFMISKYHESHVYIYESTDEKANGNDLEILVDTPKGFLKLVVQAKCIKKNLRYPSVAHMVGIDQQIDLLLKYSKKHKAIPLYLFYNTDTRFSLEENLLPTSIRKELFGCSLVHANQLKDKFFGKRINKHGFKAWKIPSFDDINPSISVPFHVLACDMLSMSAKEIVTHPVFGKSSLNDFKFFSFQEIKSDPNWNDLLPPAAIGRITVPAVDLEINRGFSRKENNISGFNPSYRIVISREPRKGGLHLIS